MTGLRTIHRIWIEGSDPMPEEYERNTRLWAEMNPGWRVVTWTKPTFPIVNECLYKRPPPHLSAHDRLRYRSDLLRLEILYSFGGLYVDMDVEPLRPIEGLIRGHTAVVAYSPNQWRGKSIITNALIWATPRHDWIKRCVGKMRISVRMFPKAFLARISGPHHVHRCHEPDDEVLVLPAERVYPMTQAQLEIAYTFHTWANRTGLTKEALV